MIIPDLQSILKGTVSIAEKSAMVQGFKDQRARTKALFDRWSAAMNAVEAGEFMPNPEQMNAINKLGELVANMRGREEQMVGWLKQAVDLGVKLKLLPASAPQQFGLEALPLVLGAAAIAGIVAVGFYAAYRATADDQAQASGVTSIVDSYVDAYTRWSAQQPSGPGSLPPAPPQTPTVLTIPRPPSSFVSSIAGTISPLLLLALGGAALLMLGRNRS
jgi:hypothetical protein